MTETEARVPNYFEDFAQAAKYLKDKGITGEAAGESLLRAVEMFAERCATEKASADQTIRKLRAALELVWRLALRRDVHLGYERASGLENDCIPCICACSLGMGMDDLTVDDLEVRLTLLRKERSNG